MTDVGTAFVYASSGNESIEIMDASLNAEFLGRLLLEINRVGEYAGTDVLTDFRDLPQEVQLMYMRFVANVVRESGYTLHEVYRLAVQYGINEHWDYINTEFEMPFEDAFRIYSEKIPYPNEEALAINMLKDICAVYQYTKDSDVLTVPEKKFFSLIFSDSTTQRDQIIRYAQVEKQIAESRIDPKDVQEISEAFSNTVWGGVGGCIGVMLSSTMMFVPGIGALIAAAIAGTTAVSGFLSSNKIKKQFSEIEMRQKIRDEIMRSYQDAEEAANGQGIPEFFDLLQQEEIKIATRIGIQRTGHTEEEKKTLDQIRTVIVDYITEFQKICVENGHEFALRSIKLANNTSIEDRRKILSILSIHSSATNYDDMIVLYDQTYSERISENFEGMLF